MNESVGQFAASTPAAIVVLERLGIDYCCGGHLPLEEACQKVGITVREIFECVRRERCVSSEERRDWIRERLCELAAFVVGTHHQYTRYELSALVKLGHEVVAKHRAEHPELSRIAEILGDLQEELVAHMLKEEQMLFPYITLLEEAVEQNRALSAPFFGSVRNPIHVMMEEHDSAGEKLSEVRRLSRAFEAPADACAKYQEFYRRLRVFDRDLRRHVHLENNILFPRAVELEAAAGLS